MGRKIPVQVYLDEGLYERLRQAARRQTLSQSELIRRLLARGLASELPPEADPAMDIIGLGASGVGDLAARHDDHLVREYRGGRG